MDKRWIQWIYLIGAWDPCLGTTFGDAPLMLDDGVETDLEISLVLVTWAETLAVVVGLAGLVD